LSYLRKKSTYAFASYEARKVEGVVGGGQDASARLGKNSTYNSVSPGGAGAFLSAERIST